ncbi:MAG TPA: slipin family protein [Candidatus Obscuribacterales bacterium]
MFGFELFGAAVVLFTLAASAIKFVTEYDRLVIFRFGRVTGVRGPGPTWISPFIESYKKVDLRMVTMSIPMQEIITKDNVSARTAAVCFFQVIDPYKVITKIEDPYNATSQIAQTTLRSVMGQHLLDEILSDRDVINAKLQAMIDRQTEGWGIKVNAVEIKDVEIPEGMQRAMARQAEAERERRAKVVAAEGEHQAAEKLAAAAEVINSVPGAMQLRQLQTMVEVASEKNSTLIFPIPIELLSFAKGASDSAIATAAAKIVSKVQQTKQETAPNNEGQTISLKQEQKQ